MKPSVVFLQEQLRAAAGTERISTGVMNELADRGVSSGYCVIWNG